VKPLRWPSDTARIRCARAGLIALTVRPNGRIRCVNPSSAALTQAIDIIDASPSPLPESVVVENFVGDALGKKVGIHIRERHAEPFGQLLSYEPGVTDLDGILSLGLSTEELYQHFAAVATTIAQELSANGVHVTTSFFLGSRLDSKLKIAQWRAGRIGKFDNALPFKTQRKPPMATPTKKAASKSAPSKGAPPKSAPKKTAPVADRFDELVEAGLIEVKVRVIPEDNRKGYAVAFGTAIVAGGLATEDWKLNWKADDTAEGQYWIEGASKPPKVEGEKWIPVTLPITANTRAKLTDLFVAAFEAA